MKEFPVGSLGVCDAEDDRVAFVPLHRFEVFHEKRLRNVGTEEFLFVLLFKSSLFEKTFDEFLLGLAKRDDSEASRRRFLEMTIDQIDDEGRFFVVVAKFAVEGSVFDVVVIDADSLMLT